jgi:hypothetical protein
MWTVIIVFLVYTVLAGALNWHVWTLLKRHRLLMAEGVKTLGTLVEVGRTTGALSVSRAVAIYRFRAEDGTEHQQREVMTRVVMTLIPGDPIEVIYLPKSPNVSQVVGNGPSFGQFIIPGIILNLLWLALFVSIFLEAFEP